MGDELKNWGRRGNKEFSDSGETRRKGKKKRRSQSVEGTEEAKKEDKSESNEKEERKGKRINYAEIVFIWKQITSKVLFKTTQTERIVKANSFKLFNWLFWFSFCLVFFFMLFLSLFWFSKEFPLFSSIIIFNFHFHSILWFCFLWEMKILNVFCYFLHFCSIFLHFFEKKLCYSLNVPFFNPKIKKKILGKKYVKLRERVKPLILHVLLFSHPFFCDCKTNE